MLLAVEEGRRVSAIAILPARPVIAATAVVFVAVPVAIAIPVSIPISIIVATARRPVEFGGA